MLRRTSPEAGAHALTSHDRRRHDHRSSIRWSISCQSLDLLARLAHLQSYRTAANVNPFDEATL